MRQSPYECNVPTASYVVQNLAQGFEFDIVVNGEILKMTAINDGVYETLTGDINSDGKVTRADVVDLVLNYGATGEIGDLIGDGQVGLTDVGLSQSNFANSVLVPSAAVPEPSTMLLTGICLFLLACRRRWIRFTTC